MLKLRRMTDAAEGGYTTLDDRYIIEKTTIMESSQRRGVVRKVVWSLLYVSPQGKERMLGEYDTLRDAREELEDRLRNEAASARLHNG